jgi:hypothetical protein
LEVFGTFGKGLDSFLRMCAASISQQSSSRHLPLSAIINHLRMRTSFILHYSLASVFDHGGPPPYNHDFTALYSSPFLLDDLEDQPTA